MDSIEECKKNNLDVFMERGPRLSYRYKVWIEARDRKDGWVLLGGLGGMGVGQMWTKETEDHKKYPGYEDAPEQDAPEQSSIESFGRTLQDLEGMMENINNAVGMTGCKGE
jgi:hypothetical protein